MKKMNLILLAIFLILLIIVVISIIYDNNHIQISNYEIESEKIPQEFNNYKILQLSDLHSKCFGKDNELLVEKINSVNPDIIVITGDMINSNEKEYDVFSKFIEKIKNYKIYFVLGNHEQSLAKNNLNKVIEILTKNNVTILKNDKVQIEKDDSRINLYGMMYLENGINMEKLLGKINKDEYNILLAHTPIDFETYAKWGPDLVFSGHVHGGIIRLPFVGGLLSPGVTFFPEYDKGKYQIDNSTMIVNTGLGYGRIKFRIFNVPEISVVTLKNK